MKLLIILMSILLASCAINQTGLEKLTPVKDPFSHQNPYYPLSVSNYWKMGHYKEVNNGELILQGHYLINVLDYKFQELYFGKRIEYLPVFRIEKQYIPLESSDTTITYQFAIKTSEGVLVSNSEPKDKIIEPFLFIPSGWTKDKLSKELTNKSIFRKVEVTTAFFEMTCMRVEIMENNIGGSILFAKDKGHVVSLLYDNYPQNTTRMDNQIVLVEYKVE